MILLWGIPEDAPLVVVQSALEQRGASVLFLDQHAIQDTSLDVCVGSRDQRRTPSRFTIMQSRRRVRGLRPPL